MGDEGGNNGSAVVVDRCNFGTLVVDSLIENQIVQEEKMYGEISTTTNFRKYSVEHILKLYVRRIPEAQHMRPSLLGPELRAGMARALPKYKKASNGYQETFLPDQDLKAWKRDAAAALNEWVQALLERHAAQNVSNVLHRLNGEDACRHMTERSRWIYQDLPDDGWIKPPAPSKDGSDNTNKPLAAVDLRTNAEKKQVHNCVLWTVLLGTADKHSPLHILQGQVDVLEVIFLHLREFWDTHIQRHGVFASRVATVKFPPPTGININMMPFVIGRPETIPTKFHGYLPLLASCPVERNEWDKVGYLTIHESVIEDEGTSQRRSGLHTETPGVLRGPGGELVVRDGMPLTVAWGRGVCDEVGNGVNYHGGIFMASNVPESCMIWNLGVRLGKTAVKCAVGHLGDIEHLRGSLGPGAHIPVNEMVWMTDRTPHESLPLQAGTQRSFFRLVTSDVSVWHKDHSTPNPLGTKPPEEVNIITGSKFSKDKCTLS